MPKILFIEHNGTEHLVDAVVGKSVMQIATDNMVPGLIGDCGGCCTCATCHGYIDADAADKLAPMAEDEAAMLDGALHVKLNSRLTCQIVFKPELDGLVVRLPVSQF